MDEAWSTLAHLKLLTWIFLSWYRKIEYRSHRSALRAISPACPCGPMPGQAPSRLRLRRSAMFRLTPVSFDYACTTAPRRAVVHLSRQTSDRRNPALIGRLRNRSQKAQTLLLIGSLCRFSATAFAVRAHCGDPRERVPTPTGHITVAVGSTDAKILDAISGTIPSSVAA